MVSKFVDMNSDTVEPVEDDAPKSKGGRRVGARNWSEKESDTLLDNIQEVLPTGNRQWENVALKLYEQGIRNRPGKACKNDSIT